MRRLANTLLGLALLGCPQEGGAPEPKERTTPVAADAPLELDKPDRARVELDLAGTRSAIRKHQQIEGSNPKSLDQLGVKLFYPSDLEYDPSAGTVKSKTYPTL